MRDAHKVTGLVDLIRFFEAGGSTTSEIVAEKYGITQRSAQRWLFAVERWVPLEMSEGRTPTYRKVTFR